MNDIQNTIQFNRLNFGQKTMDAVQRIDANQPKSSLSFEETLRAEINPNIQGKVSSSSIRLPHNIKKEIESDEYRKKLFDASVEFESIFVKMMLSQMKKSVQKSGMIDGGYAEEIFEDMLYDEYSKKISQNESLGIAEEIYRTLSQSLPKVDIKG
ncbi:MAG TPA: rod-binding protein [Leptospiraceae bacterium]|nr:rod-binding protein [Leptospiraceae bacterium]HMW06780.1 rod-binding protein [Leptospiraceae bacterium]HMX35175.1 rod-binding protein [Leptospiraceae bacterium]HMY32274.1 rod-binding protein [Leptospiraceae bacterium]HMZ63963.1 rod-binding protein [Leptospiraceae bacterium]